MNTTITSGDMILSADAPTFPISAVKLAETRTKCLAMKVAGINDVEGFKIADRARMDVKADRCAVANRAKDLKKQIKTWSDTNIDAPADALIAELATIEKYLESQTEPVETERKRIKTEAEEKKKRDAETKLAGRLAALIACRASYSTGEVAAMLDTDFATLLTNCQHADSVRKEQEAEEQRKREADAAELAELRKLKAEQAKVVSSQPIAVAVDPSQEKPIEREMRENGWTVERLSPPATNAIPSRPTTAIPVAPAAPVESSTTNRDRDRRRLLEFADWLEQQRPPNVSTENSRVRDACQEEIVAAVKEIRKIVNESLPEVVAVAATDETEPIEVSVDDI